MNLVSNNFCQETKFMEDFQIKATTWQITVWKGVDITKPNVSSESSAGQQKRQCEPHMQFKKAVEINFNALLNPLYLKYNFNTIDIKN